MIKLENVNIYIKDKHLLRDINLEIPAGSVYALMGNNGAGKTMLLKSIMGLTDPASGTITIHDVELGRKTKAEAFRHIGVLIETPPLYAHLSVYENLRLKQTLLDLEPPAIDFAIEFCNLSEHSHKKITQISLGTKQRLGLALAFISKPAIIILDEPSSTLDPKAAIEFRKLVLRMNRELGTTFLIASHSMEEVEEIATHICFMKSGSILIADTTANVLKSGLSRTNLPDKNEQGETVTADDTEMFKKIMVTTRSEEEYRHIINLLDSNELTYEILNNQRLKDFFYDK